MYSQGLRVSPKNTQGILPPQALPEPPRIRHRRDASHFSSSLSPLNRGYNCSSHNSGTQPLLRPPPPSLHKTNQGLFPNKLSRKTREKEGKRCSWLKAGYSSPRAGTAAALTLSSLFISRQVAIQQTQPHLLSCYSLNYTTQ